jgi:hypothetical protein
MDDLKENVNAKVRETDSLQFICLKNVLASKSLRSHQQTNDGQGWQKGLAVTFFDEGIPELVP